MRIVCCTALLLGCVGDPAADKAEPPTEGVSEMGGGLTLGWVQIADDERLAYVCGRGESLADTRWFKGWDRLAAVDGSAWEIVLGDVDWELVVDGEPVDAGEHRPYADDGTSGMYDADTGCHTGVIVDDDEMVGAWCDGTGAVAQVEPVGTIVAQDGTLRVQVLLDDGAAEFDVTRISWSD
ncbi:MAG: hypothetical protein ACI8PZ_001201 [Myxococcota bacterium]|jgi:hypothetical protein